MSDTVFRLVEAHRMHGCGPRQGDPGPAGVSTGATS